MKADVSRRETFFAVIAAIAVFALLAPTAVQAATSSVRVKGTVKIASTDGVEIESEAIGPMGILQAEGSDGAIAVRNYAGGGGFLGAADCSAETELSGLPNFVETSNTIVTGVLITGTNGTVTVTSDAVGGGVLPLLNWTVSADNPNFVATFGTGLTTTAPLTFTCTDGAGGDGSANVVILGQ